MIGLLCGIVGEEVFGLNGKSLFLCMIVALQKVDLLFIYFVALQKVDLLFIYLFIWCY